VLLRLPLIPGINDARRSRTDGAITPRSPQRRGHRKPIYCPIKCGEGKIQSAGRKNAMGDTPVPSAEALHRAAAIFEAAGISVTIGG